MKIHSAVLINGIILSSGNGLGWTAGDPCWLCLRCFYKWQPECAVKVRVICEVGRRYSDMPSLGVYLVLLWDT